MNVLHERPLLLEPLLMSLEVMRYAVYCLQTNTASLHSKWFTLGLKLIMLEVL